MPHFPQWLRVLPLLLIAALAAACTDGRAADRAPRLPGGEPSLHALGEAAWTALAAADTAAMDRLRLTEREHNELVWPALPASDPTLNVSLDFVWGNLQMRSHWDRAKLLRRHAGSDARVLRTTCPGEPQEYPEFRVLTGCALLVRTTDGRERRVRLFDDVLELEGEFKIFRYQAD